MNNQANLREQDPPCTVLVGTSIGIYGCLCYYDLEALVSVFPTSGTFPFHRSSSLKTSKTINMTLLIFNQCSIHSSGETGLNFNAGDELLVPTCTCLHVDYWQWSTILVKKNCDARRLRLAVPLLVCHFDRKSCRMMQNQFNQTDDIAEGKQIKTYTAQSQRRNHFFLWFMQKATGTHSYSKVLNKQGAVRYVDEGFRRQ